jgi:hypothetical protein
METVGAATGELSQADLHIGGVEPRPHDQDWDYGEWVDLLGASFFTPERAGAPVTFFVDDDILAALSGLPPTAATVSLVRAIIDLFGELSESRAYDDIARSTGAWERSGSEGYIRCLPLLALAVLAGTKMATDETIRKTNYYKRYRALIGMPGRGQPPGYDTMPELWDAYTRWLDVTREGALGLSSVGEHPVYRYIGPALSQALFRASDRHELTYFLDSLGAPVTDAITGDRLLGLLRAWAAWRGRFSAGARLLIKDPAYAAQVEMLIRDVARSWDGTVLDELGRRESRILLHWNYEDGEPMTTLAERPDGFPDAITIHSGARDGLLEALPGTRFYREPPVAVDADLLLYGRRIRLGSYSFRLPGSGIHVLAENEEIPGWSSARRFVWSCPHVIVTDAATAQILRPLIERGAEPGFSGPRPNVALPDGWVAFRSVVPRPEAGEAWAASPLGQLLPIESPQASLINGLRLSRARVYLAGGEPDLVCPVDAFWLDGVRHTVVPGSVVSLRGHGLQAGRHVVIVGAQRMRFAVVRGSAGMPTAIEQPAALRVAPDASVSGAAAPPDWARDRWTQVVRSRRSYTAFGARPGQVAKLERQAQIPRTAREVWSQYGEVEVPFEPVWLLASDQRLGRSVKLVAPREPGEPLGTEALRNAWVSFFLTPMLNPPGLWLRYAEIAKDLAGAHGAG